MAVKRSHLGRSFADLCEVFAFFAVNFLLSARPKEQSKQDNRKERKETRKGAQSRLAFTILGPSAQLLHLTALALYQLPTECFLQTQGPDCD
jgi:hypothetical protein